MNIWMPQCSYTFKWKKIINCNVLVAPVAWIKCFHLMLILILCCACRCLYSAILGNISIFGKNCTETYHTWLSGKVDIKARGRDLDKYETFSKNWWRGISTNIKFLQQIFGFLNLFLFSTDKQANTHTCNNLRLLQRSLDHHCLISIRTPKRAHEKEMYSEEKLYWGTPKSYGMVFGSFSFQLYPYDCKNLEYIHKCNYRT